MRRDSGLGTPRREPYRDLVDRGLNRALQSSTVNVRRSRHETSWTTQKENRLGVTSIRRGHRKYGQPYRPVSETGPSGVGQLSSVCTEVLAPGVRTGYASSVVRLQGPTKAEPRRVRYEEGITSLLHTHRVEWVALPMVRWCVPVDFLVEMVL